MAGKSREELHRQLDEALNDLERNSKPNESGEIRISTDDKGNPIHIAWRRLGPKVQRRVG
jgi:hypothetical protein